MGDGEKIGEVIHFFDRISVAVLRLEKKLKLGDEVHFLGRDSDFSQTIDSMQIEHEAVSECKAGEEVAVKVQQPVRRGDTVLRGAG
jgi:translation elongation factor EF-Tu-like GTPase